MKLKFTISCLHLREAVWVFGLEERDTDKCLRNNKLGKQYLMTVIPFSKKKLKNSSIVLLILMKLLTPFSIYLLNNVA